MRGHAKRRDANEPSIVEALRAAGASVSRLNDPGLPDLIVGYRGKTKLLEVKVVETKAGKAHKRDGQGGAGELTEAQAKWWAGWGGETPAIVHDVNEALAAMRDEEDAAWLHH